MLFRSRELLGKHLCTNLDGITGGMIVETEAYSWRESGCHAFNNRKTARNSMMFESGGVAYVYKCYGIHHLINLVTGESESGEAVLIRAIQPDTGTALMQARTGQSLKKITAGPGKLTKALGIDMRFNGADLKGDLIWIEDKKVILKSSQIIASARIGIEYAGADAKLPWRFSIADNDYVSRMPR